MNWNDFFKSIKNKEYVLRLESFLNEEYKNKVIYPPKELIFNAFTLTPLEDVKVVILGQDPYHEVNQAMGLAFSVPEGIKLPPSLINIFKEIQNEYHTNLNINNGDLTYLAKQGVLLLNPILTVEEGRPLSHKCKEYDLFFKDLMNYLDNLDQPICFMLWGGNAKKYKNYLNNKHLILEANHPSPLSANRGGWFNNNHFILCNEYLKKNNLKEIEWLPYK